MNKNTFFASEWDWLESAPVSLHIQKAKVIASEINYLECENELNLRKQKVKLNCIMSSFHLIFFFFIYVKKKKLFYL